MKEVSLLTRTAEFVIGSSLDWLGSTRVNEQTYVNVTTYDLADSRSGEVIGQGFVAVRDGWVEINSFSKPSSLRKKIFPKQ